MTLVRRGPGTLYRRLQSVRFLLVRDRRAVLAFLAARYPVPLSRVRRLDLVRRFVGITNQVRSYHQQAEILTVADRVFRRAGRPGLTVVECGAGKGGSTAKLSLVARLAGARLVVFDSFRGVPANAESHADLLGRRMTFREGAFRGRLREVQGTVERFGAPEVVEWRKGWFADTLPAFDAAVDVALVDVDLLASTRTCLAHLVPRLRPDGVLFSQDGHLRATVDLLGCEAFWQDEVGVPPPAVHGLGTTKLLEIVPAQAGTGRSQRQIAK